MLIERDAAAAPLRPAPREHAGDLGHQPDAPADGPHGLRRGERRHQEPVLLSGGLQIMSGLTLSYNRIFIFFLTASSGPSTCCLQAGLGTRSAPCPEPIHELLPGHRHRTRGRVNFRASAPARGLGRLRLSQIGTVDPALGPDLYRRLLHGGGARRRGQAVGTVSRPWASAAQQDPGAIHALQAWGLPRWRVLVLVILFLQKKAFGPLPIERQPCRRLTRRRSRSGAAAHARAVAASFALVRGHRAGAADELGRAVELGLPSVGFPAHPVRALPASPSGAGHGPALGLYGHPEPGAGRLLRLGGYCIGMYLMLHIGLEG